jgi:SnoaL-like domain
VRRAGYGDVVVADESAAVGVADDRAAIAQVIRTFFAAFTSGAGCTARLDALAELFLPAAVIVRTGGEPVVYGVESFIAPRRALLTGGTLVDFREWELSGHTEVFGDIAQHFCSYAKAGVQNGTPFTGRGMKTMQFIRTSAGWRISAAAWADEHDGLSIGADYIS